MQPRKEPTEITLENGVRLRFDPNDANGKYAVSIRTRQGARITGYFPLTDLIQFADAIGREVYQVARERADEALTAPIVIPPEALEAFRREREGNWPIRETPEVLSTSGACKGAGIVYQCHHGEPLGGCKCMGSHDVIVMPCPENCPAGRD